MNNNQNSPTSNDHQQLTPGSSVAITLRKGERGFGFSIRGGEGMPLFVLRIADGGAASQDGRIKVRFIDRWTIFVF